MKSVSFLQEVFEQENFNAFGYESGKTGRRPFNLNVLHENEVAGRPFDLNILHEGGIIEDDTRVRINASIKKAPFRYICRIRITRPDGYTGSGSGLLIGPKTVLTAGHVIWDDVNNRKWDVSRVKVIPAQNGSVSPFGVFNVSDMVTSYSGFNSGDFVTGKDYAIIHLTTSAAETVGYWGKKLSTDPIGCSILQRSLPLPAGAQKVNLSGYPGDKGRNTPQWGSYQYWSYNYTKALESGGTILTYLNDMYPGHSGGPVWVTRSADNGGRNLVAINVGYFTDGSRNIGAFITDTVRSFITANTI